jgi:hypothetical protein
MAQPHPLGLEPNGNHLLRGGANLRDTGLGCLAALPDAVLQDLLGRLDASTLGRLALTCRAAYVLANLEEAWRGLTLEVRCSSDRAKTGHR